MMLGSPGSALVLYSSTMGGAAAIVYINYTSTSKYVQYTQTTTATEYFAKNRKTDRREMYKGTALLAHERQQQRKCVLHGGAFPHTVLEKKSSFPEV